jgi:hypothetical protein
VVGQGLAQRVVLALLQHRQQGVDDLPLLDDLDLLLLGEQAGLGGGDLPEDGREGDHRLQVLVGQGRRGGGLALVGGGGLRGERLHQQGGDVGLLVLAQGVQDLVGLDLAEEVLLAHGGLLGGVGYLTILRVADLVAGVEV